MKKTKRINNVIIIATFIVFAIAMIYVTFYISAVSSTSIKYFNGYNVKLNNELKKVLAQQKETDARINELSEFNQCSFKKPCVINNPYGLNPLSAVAIFTTDKKEKIELYINDVLITTFNESKKHIIPIYGLYGNTNNFVSLKTLNGEESVVKITTEQYNDDLNDFEVYDYLHGKNNMFVVGDLNKKSIIRAFDYQNNLMLYMNFGYINGITYMKDHFYISYNSQKSKDTDLRNLKIEMDYFGKIYSITTDTSDIKDNTNLTIGKIEYNIHSKNIYDETSHDYEIVDLVDNISTSPVYRIDTSEIDSSLTNAKPYDKEYAFAHNGKYISYDIKTDYEKSVRLLVVTKTNKTYMYNLSKNGIIKSDIASQGVLFIEEDGIIYSLQTIINS